MVFNVASGFELDEKRNIYKPELRNATMYCPHCGEKMCVSGTKNRRVAKVTEERRLMYIRLRVLRCKKCNKYHLELLEGMVPYITVGCDILSKSMEDDTGGLDAYETTVKKWKALGIRIMLSARKGIDVGKALYTELILQVKKLAEVDWWYLKTAPLVGAE